MSPPQIPGGLMSTTGQQVLMMLLLLLTTVRHFTKTTTSLCRLWCLMILFSDVSLDNCDDAHIQYPAHTPRSARRGDILSTVLCKESVPSSLLRAHRQWWAGQPRELRVVRPRFALGFFLCPCPGAGAARLVCPPLTQAAWCSGEGGWHLREKYSSTARRGIWWWAGADPDMVTSLTHYPGAQL